MKKVNLVAVYGSLRKSMSNNLILMSSKFIGTFHSEPEYTMYNINNMFPGVTKEGYTSIVMEVYEIDKAVEEKLNRLEGYSENNENSDNFYDRTIINTPYGNAYLYIFNDDTTHFEKVESGDWVKEKKQTKSMVSNLYESWD